MNTWSQQQEHKNYTNLLLTGYECKPVKIGNQEPLMIQIVRTVQKTEAFCPSPTSIRLNGSPIFVTLFEQIATGLRCVIQQCNWSLNRFFLFHICLPRLNYYCLNQRNGIMGTLQITNHISKIAVFLSVRASFFGRLFSLDNEGFSFLVEYLGFSQNL